MTTFAAYLSGVPSGEKNNHKRELLLDFAAGVEAAGDTSVLQASRALIPADVAMIQGWVHEGSPSTPHLVVRREVIEFQRSQQNRTLIVDSNVFNYYNQDKYYSRYSFDGVFPPTGCYFDSEVDTNRWQTVFKNIGLELKPWRNRGRHILICTQRNGGWSMRSLDVVSWLHSTISEIRQYSDRPIVVRPHPGDKNARRYLTASSDLYKLSENTSILQDFHKAHAVITYNSSPGVAAAIEGVPVFVTDPRPEYSQAFAVANTDLSKIEKPVMPDRELWLSRLAMSHWNRDEIRSGLAWRHFKKFI